MPCRLVFQLSTPLAPFSSSTTHTTAALESIPYASLASIIYLEVVTNEESHGSYHGRYDSKTTGCFLSFQLLVFQSWSVFACSSAGDTISLTHTRVPPPRSDAVWTAQNSRLLAYSGQIQPRHLIQLSIGKQRTPLDIGVFLQRHFFSNGSLQASDFGFP